MKRFTVRWKQSHQPAAGAAAAAATAKKNRRQRQKQSTLRAQQAATSRRCAGALCCGGGGSRLSVSSNVSNSSSSSYSDFALFGTVQSRPDRMFADELGDRRRTCIVLVAVDKSSRDPKGDFRRSIAEVITSKRLEEPKELRSLLNCYMAMNDPELRRVILEAFHEVCTALFFACSSGGGGGGGIYRYN